MHRNLSPASQYKYPIGRLLPVICGGRWQPELKGVTEWIEKRVGSAQILVQSGSKQQSYCGTRNVSGVSKNGIYPLHLPRKGNSSHYYRMARKCRVRSRELFRCGWTAGELPPGLYRCSQNQSKQSCLPPPVFAPPRAVSTTSERHLPPLRQMSVPTDTHTSGDTQDTSSTRGQSLTARQNTPTAVRGLDRLRSHWN
jgi:hypothetical protein